MSTPDAAPLILTLELDPATFARFDGLRRAHFPPALNHIPAHLTLFHALPGHALPDVIAAVRAAAPAQPVPLRVTGLRLLGRGVAYEIASDGLAAFRAALARAFAADLTPQDRQPFRPHVTVQNKVAPEQARALRDALAAGFTPFEGRGVGALVWRYRGGPWEEAAAVPFAGAPAF